MAAVSNKKKTVNKNTKKKITNATGIATSVSKEPISRFNEFFGGAVDTVTSISKEKLINPNYSFGHFGKTITFRVSDKKVLTFKDMNRTVSGRWTTHSAIGKKEKTEFIGPGLDKINMTLILSYAHGVKPQKVIKRLEKVAKNGTAKNLVIGGKKIGKNKYRITSMSESWDEIYNNGFLYQANVDVTFEEYVE